MGPVCVCVINMKGGVGKTTIAALLGRHASIRRRLKVLAVDLDPQANLSQAFMRQGYFEFLDSKQPSIVELFDGYLPPGGGRSSASPIDVEDVLVRNTPLGGGNLQLIPSRFGFSDHLMGASKPDARILAKLIAEEFQDRDLVLIDCSPTESIFTWVAYHASRYVLVPVKPEFFATIGFPLLKDSLNQFRSRNTSQDIDVAGIVINNPVYHYSGNRGGPERHTSLVQLHEAAARNQWHVFHHQIPFSRGFPKMMRGNFSHLGDTDQFDYFAEEFFDRLLGSSGVRGH